MYESKLRKVFKGLDNDLGWEITWIVYNVEDLTQYERQKVCEKLLEMKGLDHPNVVKYYYVHLNKDNNEITVITELVGSLRSYIKKVNNPKLKVVTSWWIKILDGLKYLFSKGITQVNLSGESIYASEEGEIKIGDIIIDHKFRHSQRFSKKNSNMDPNWDKLLSSDERSMVNSFGKAVLYMLFHQSTVHKSILKILHSSNSDFLFDNIVHEDLRDFLKKWLIDESFNSFKKLREHRFLKNSHNDSKLQLEPDLIEYLESRNVKKGTLDDLSSICPYSIKEEDSKYWLLKLFN